MPRGCHGRGRMRDHNSRSATVGHRYQLHACVTHLQKRAELNVLSLRTLTGPNRSGRAPCPSDCCPCAPQATAGSVERRSLSRRSARRRWRLPATADGSGLPRGSASVVRQLGGMGARSWSRRERQMACSEAVTADAGNKREETGREGGAGVARTSREKGPH